MEWTTAVTVRSLIVVTLYLHFIGSYRELTQTVPVFGYGIVSFCVLKSL